MQSSHLPTSVDEPEASTTSTNHPNKKKKKKKKSQPASPAQTDQKPLENDQAHKNNLARLELKQRLVQRFRGNRRYTKDVTEQDNHRLTEILMSDPVAAARFERGEPVAIPNSNLSFTQKTQAPHQTKPPKNTIFDHASKGNSTEIKKYLDNKGDPNRETLDGKSLLYFAVLSDNVPTIKLLVEAKADLHIGRKHAALREASEHARHNAANYLLSLYLKNNHLSDDQDTDIKNSFIMALGNPNGQETVACFINQLNLYYIVCAASHIHKMLEESKQFPTMQNIGQVSLLLVRQRKHLLQVINERLTQNPSQADEAVFCDILRKVVSYRDKELETLLFPYALPNWKQHLTVAITCGYSYLTEKFLQESARDTKMNISTPYLTTSSRKGITRSQLEGAYTQRTDLLDVSLLITAATFLYPNNPKIDSHHQIMELLIANPVIDINAAVLMDSMDQHTTVVSQDFDYARYLGPNMHIRMPGETSDRLNLLAITLQQGTTALMVAVRNGDKAMVKRLLDAKANPNAITFNGATALMMAVYNRKTSIASLLLEYGADPHLHYITGDTAFTLAEKNNDRDMSLLLNKIWLRDYVANAWDTNHYSDSMQPQTEKLVAAVVSILLDTQSIFIPDSGDLYIDIVRLRKIIPGIPEQIELTQLHMKFSPTDIHTLFCAAFSRMEEEKLTIEEIAQSIFLKACQMNVSPVPEQTSTQGQKKQIIIEIKNTPAKTAESPRIHKPKPGTEIIDAELELLRGLISFAPSLDPYPLAQLVTWRNALLITFSQMVRKIASCHSTSIFSYSFRQLAKHLGNVIFHGHDSCLSLADGNTKRNRLMNKGLENMVKGFCDFIILDNPSRQDMNEILNQINSVKLIQLSKYRIPQTTLSIRIEQVYMACRELNQYNHAQSVLPDWILHKAWEFNSARFSTYLTDELLEQLADNTNYLQIKLARSEGASYRHPEWFASLTHPAFQSPANQQHTLGLAEKARHLHYFFSKRDFNDDALDLIISYAGLNPA